MALWHGESRRKKTGGRRRYARGKRRYEIGREKRETTIGEHKRQVFRVRGRNQKIRVLCAGVANVLDVEKNKCKLTKILSVVNNPANPHYTRRNIITKSAIIETELGKARVTSRPGQEGVINAVLVK